MKRWLVTHWLVSLALYSCGYIIMTRYGVPVWASLVVGYSFAIGGAITAPNHR